MNKFYDHIIVGMGMASLGVLEALKDLDQSSILIIDYKEWNSEIFLNSKNEPMITGKIGDGGNSDLWHGVISKMSSIMDNRYDELFESLIQRFYPNFAFQNLDGNSFIPLRPLRPKKIIKNKFKNFNIIYDKLLKIENKDTFVNLYCQKSTYKTKTLWMCTGATSTLNILANSEILSEKEYFLDEHYVGYFGQSLFGNKMFKINLKYLYNGHYKNYITIKGQGGHSMYLSMRPAHFGFKNLTYASNYRNFFSKKKSSIIFKLITKINLGLILEAFYNKFGVYFKSKTFNLTGHIEIPKSIRFCTNNRVFSFLNTSIKLSETDKINIKNAFGNDLKILDEIKIGAGIHYLNLDKPIAKEYIDDNLLNPANKNTSVFICSTATIKTLSPEHPTFSLLVLSYKKAFEFVTNN